MKGIQQCTVQIIDVGIHTHQEYIHVYTYKQRKYDGEGKQRTKPTFLNSGINIQMFYKFDDFAI